MRYCELCWRREAVGRCRICGRMVCGECLGKDGVCEACRSSLCQICGSKLAIGSCSVCGRLVCEDCSIQIDPVRRVCRECYSRGLKPASQPSRALALFTLRFLGSHGAQ